MAIRKSGVNTKLIKQYKFEDHIWSKQNVSQADDLLVLANSAVKIKNDYWMRKGSRGQWNILASIVDAKKEAVNMWMGRVLPSGDVIDSELIDMFFDGIIWQTVKVGKKDMNIKVPVGSCPNLQQRLIIPLGDQFVTYNNQQYLNTWYDDMTVSNIDELSTGKLVLLMCYGALCNGTVDKDNLDLEADRIYKMVLTNDYDNKEFKFLMHWLAALYQTPGINLLTNIWLLGEVEGLGKGTIVTIMSHILGREFVGKLNQTEVEAGWNDHLVGKQLIEINEFDTSGKMTPKAWGLWLKSHTIEPEFKVRQRNTTSYFVPHIGNYLCTGNVLDQRVADKNDRRNQFIQTSGDIWWTAFATKLQLSFLIPAPESVASGFAYILDQVQVDHNLIKRAFVNDIRTNIVSNNKNIVEEWLDNDATPVGRDFQNATKMFEEYFCDWYKKSGTGSRPVVTATAWGKMMAVHPKVNKKRTKSAVLYQVVEIGRVDPAPPELDSITAQTEKVRTSAVAAVELDLDTPVPQIIHSALTPMQRLQAELKKDKTA